jgi:general L-amino acid transport system permease protein
MNLANEPAARVPMAPLHWIRNRLFGGWASGCATLIILYVAVRLLPPFFKWAWLDAVWSAEQAADCRNSHGACWAFVADKFRFILFGTFPADEHWRPALVMALLVALCIVSGYQLARAQLAALWSAGLTMIAILMCGGIFGLAYVENQRWGGLTLTLLLSTIGIALAFPLAILLALGRRSAMPIIRWFSVGYIELIRGIPLISLLFMASVMLPLFLPQGVAIDKLLRTQLAMVLFAAAYLAEVIRGGLQAIPVQQEEAALALGLSYWQRTRYVTLPQALRIAIPPLVNTFIGFFKDTSLVVIIGLIDFLSAIKVSLNEPAWSGFGVEAYLFAALGYFVFCYPMSRYSQGLERRTAQGLARRSLSGD